MSWLLQAIKQGTINVWLTWRKLISIKSSPSISTPVKDSEPEVDHSFNVLEFLRAELDSVKKERDYFRDLLLTNANLVPRPISGEAPKVTKEMMQALKKQATNSVRRRLEEADRAAYLEKIKGLELQTLAAEVGLIPEGKDGSTH